MTEDELVEKVAEAMRVADDYYVSYDQARAAIDVVLEAAAQVCVSPHGGWVSDDRLACADEIRALIG